MMLVDVDVGLALGALLGLLELLHLVEPGAAGSTSLFVYLCPDLLSGLLVTSDPVDFLVAG